MHHSLLTRQRSYEIILQLKNTYTYIGTSYIVLFRLD